MIIIGITGTLGAGKGTVVDYLVKDKGFTHYSVRGYLIKQIKKLGMSVNRDSMTKVANELRASHTPYYIIEELFKEAAAIGDNAIIESIRTPGEVDFLKKQPDFILIAVDADQKVRYDRITIRGSETDHIDYSTFKANEEREYSSNDPNKQNLSKCIEMADVTIYNNGDIEELQRNVDIVLENKKY